jgi:hypothetical protein
MHRCKSLSVLLVLLVTSIASSYDAFAGKPYTDADTFSDTWVATDALGREAPGFQQCGPVKRNKRVGIFYWTWHTPGRGGPHDNTKILAEARAGKVQWPSQRGSHHWGEPELGYYLMTDPFVIRKHAGMLVDAGIDAVFFDTTNPPFTWKDEYEALCREYTAMRQEGARTPTISFITPFGDPTPVTDRLWTDLYKPGLWTDLWFMWDGKPLLLANRTFIKNQEMQRFFTFRRPMPDYWLGPSGPDQWSWLEVYPQHAFKNSQGEVEQMSVGVAQNALPDTPGPAPMSHRAGAMGRSWHQGKKDSRADAHKLGLNFDEQWTRVREVDPKFVFVTGWNEWIAGRFLEWHIYTDKDCYHPGGMFVDQYDQEYSRDCEPMRGAHSDNYYHQLANHVRRFKGVRERPKANGPSRIAIDGSFGDWSDVSPEFRDTIGDTTQRNHPGYGNLVYRNTTGRNDFVIAKAAYDREHLFFFVQTLDKISPRSDPHWMLLLIDADQDAETGSLGYDYVVNLELISDNETTVKRWRDGSWKTVARADYCVNGNGMEIQIPRAMLGRAGLTVEFDFHWTDNIQRFGEVSELGVNGDSAPNRRWNYRYEITK